MKRQERWGMFRELHIAWIDLDKAWEVMRQKASKILYSEFIESIKVYVKNI